MRAHGPDGASGPSVKRGALTARPSESFAGVHRIMRDLTTPPATVPVPEGVGRVEARPVGSGRSDRPGWADATDGHETGAERASSPERTRTGRSGRTDGPSASNRVQERASLPASDACGKSSSSNQPPPSSASTVCEQPRCRNSAEPCKVRPAAQHGNG